MQWDGTISVPPPRVQGERRLCSALDESDGSKREKVAGLILDGVLAEFGAPVPMAPASTILDQAIAKFGAPIAAVEDLVNTDPFQTNAEDKTTTNCPTNDDAETIEQGHTAEGSASDEHDDSESVETRNCRRKSHRLCKVKRERLNKLARRLAAREPVELSAELQGNEFLMNKLRNKIKQHQRSNQQVAASSVEQQANRKESAWPCANLGVADAVAADPAAKWTHTVGWMHMAMSGWTMAERMPESWQ